MSDENVKSVPLEDRHVELGGRMVPFAGYSLPVQFTGVKDEHRAIRNGVGVFDVSHMGEVEIRGDQALDCADRLFTNDIRALENGQAMYTAMCKPDGGIVDDLVVYRLADDHVFVCVNGANRDKDFAHILKYGQDFDVTIADRGNDWAQLAIQGPKAPDLVAAIATDDVKSIVYYHARFGTVAGVDNVLISRTGYTGEDGYELYIPVSGAHTVFDALLEAGTEFGLKLCGLGCRDTLRLESKYLLYGQDIDESTNPVEAGLNWVVKLDRPANFVGRRAIESIKSEGVTRRMRGLVLQGKGVIRPHYKLFASGTDNQIGETTSGSFAPTLEQSIGLGYIAIDHVKDQTVDVEIRTRRVPATVTTKPFYKRS